MASRRYTTRRAREIETSSAFVLQKGAQVDSRSEKGTTPLMRAAVGGSVPAIRCLIAFGADVTLKDKAGATAERFAVKYGNNEARDVLKERARVLELVAWHRAAVREAAFWVQEAAAADAAVLLQRPYFVVRVDGVEGVDHNPPRRRSTRWRPRPSARASKRIDWNRRRKLKKGKRSASRRPRRSGSASRRPRSGGASSRRSLKQLLCYSSRPSHPLQTGRGGAPSTAPTRHLPRSARPLTQRWAFLKACVQSPPNEPSSTCTPPGW